jgi:pimeloyl-ACP methyl ester carboxylesterase
MSNSSSNTMSNSYRETRNDAKSLQTRLGPVAWRSSGQGPALVFFAGALANGDLWRDVVAALSERYRCITVDLPLGAHPWPLSTGADRSAGSLARLLLDCLELLDVDDATVIANDTAGGLLLLSLASGHSALQRIGRLVLTNCESYDKFPPDQLKRASALSRTLPRLAETLIRLQLRTAPIRRKVVSGVAASGLDRQRTDSFFEPARRDQRVAADLVAAMAGFRPQLLIDAAAAIPQFTRPVLLIWGDSCEFFPMSDAQRLASEFPSAALVTVPGRHGSRSTTRSPSLTPSPTSCRGIQGRDRAAQARADRALGISCWPRHDELWRHLAPPVGAR